MTAAETARALVTAMVTDKPTYPRVAKQLLDEIVQVAGLQGLTDVVTELTFIATVMVTQSGDAQGIDRAELLQELLAACAAEELDRPPSPF